MGVAYLPGMTQGRSVNQGGMVQTILEYTVAPSGKRRHHTKVSHVAGGKQQCPGPPRKRGEIFFQRLVSITVTGHKMSGATADTKTPGAFLQRFDQARVIGQAQVIVTAKGQILMSVNPHPDALRAFQCLPGTIKLLLFAHGKRGGKVLHGDSGRSQSEALEQLPVLIRFRICCGQ